MEKAMRIVFACLGVVIVLGAAALGTLFGIHLSRTRLAQKEQTTVTETATEQTAALMTQTDAATDVATDNTTDDTEVASTVSEPAETQTAAPTTAPATAHAKPTTTVPAETSAARTTTRSATTARAATTRATTAAPATTAAATAAAHQGTTYKLTVTSDGGATEVTGSGRYAPGTLVKVSVTPLLRHSFRRWDSSDEEAVPDGTTATYTFRMPAKDITMRAVTYERPLVSLVKGKGVASVSGARYYSPGDKVTVSARMEDGYEFAKWKSAPSGLDSEARVFVFTMPDHSVTLTASGTPKTYTVRVNLGKGVRSVTGDGGHKVGEKVTVRVKMYDDYAFRSWDTPGGVYTDESYTFIMPAHDVTLTASGTAKPKYLLTVDRGDGIQSVGGGGRYTVGSFVTVTCVPERGYTFVTWLSSDSRLVKDSFMKNYTFTMPGADVALTAYAEKTQYKLTLKKGEGIIAVKGEGKYAAGDSVTVSCTAADGYAFTEWTSAGRITVPTGKTQTYTFTMPDCDVALTAKAAPVADAED